MTDPTPAFTAFGRVTAKIAACEQIMRLAIGEREVGRAQRNGDAGPDRFNLLIQRMAKWDLGQLSHRVRTQFALPDDPWIQIFKDEKELRNAVAHEFWNPYYSLLQSDEGVVVIIRHCDVIERHFDHLSEGIISVTGVNVQLFIDFISTNSWRKEALEEFALKLEDAEKVVAGLPPWPIAGAKISG